MRGPISALGTFLRELKRRKVYQVTAAYVILAAAGLELVDILVPSTSLPEWSGTFFLALAIVGLPVVIVFAWVFDITSDGLVRTEGKPADAGSGGSGEPTRAVNEPSAGQPPKTLDPTALAILPFDNLSGSAEAEPFAVGLHDDLLTELSRASALTVISRSSVRGFRGADRSIREIAEELGVGTVVEGSVQMAGSRVRLNIQVIDARNDAQRWAERYDRELTTQNIFDLQTELAGRIMAALKARLTEEEQARSLHRPTGDLEAYRLYFMGQEAALPRSEEGFLEAIRHFEAAIDLDPEYALAWTGLGQAKVGLLDYQHRERDESLLAEAQEACQRALELDPHLAEAHAAMGGLRAYLRDAPGALESHERAIRERPSFAGAHQWRCWVQLLLGDGEGALESGVMGTRLAPLDPEARVNLAFAQLATGDLPGALANGERSRSQHPEFDYGRWAEALALLEMGREGEAEAAFQDLNERWARGWNRTGKALRMLADGDRGGARAILGELRDLGEALQAGLIHAGLGEMDEAFAAIRGDWPPEWDDVLFIRFMRSGPMDALRADARFRDLSLDLDRSYGVLPGPSNRRPPNPAEE